MDAVDGVPWKAYDLDVYNHTLSDTYPEEVTLVQPSRGGRADIIKIMRKVNQVARDRDRPAGPYEQDHSFGHRPGDFPKFAAQAEARATVLIFPIDEISDMETSARRSIRSAIRSIG